VITARIEIDFEETDKPSVDMVMEYITSLYENNELFIEWKNSNETTQVFCSKS